MTKYLHVRQHLPLRKVLHLHDLLRLLRHLINVLPQLHLLFLLAQSCRRKVRRIHQVLDLHTHCPVVLMSILLAIAFYITLETDHLISHGTLHRMKRAEVILMVGWNVQTICHGMAAVGAVESDLPVTTPDSELQNVAHHLVMKAVTVLETVPVMGRIVTFLYLKQELRDTLLGRLDLVQL